MLFDGILRHLLRRGSVPSHCRERVVFSAASDVGIVREQNQDNLFLMSPVLPYEQMRHYTVSGTKELPILFAICDGMGGGQYGEQASFLAVSRIAQTDVGSLEMYSDRQLEHFFLQLFEDMNREVFDTFGHLGVLVGCTATVFYMDHSRVYLVNAGDSPGMCLDSQGLHLLTQSDNRANQLYLMGQISEQERWTHKTKNQLTQHIGMDAREVRLSPHIRRMERPGESAVFLICSDGLLDRYSFPDLEHALRKEIEQGHIPECAQHCVNLAMEAGSRDNVTAVVIQVEARNDA